MKRLSSAITLGKFKFSGVHEARVIRSLYHLNETAYITIPSKANILWKDGTKNTEANTATLFKAGDPVKIQLGYDGKLNTEFEGFVRHSNHDMPLTITCEGYIYQLKRNKVAGYWKTTTLKEMLQEAVKGTDITVKCDVDVKLRNILVPDTSGAKMIAGILELIDSSVSVCFLEPRLLWCGLVYEPYSKGENPFSEKTVKYRLGFNCLHRNTLQPMSRDMDPVEVHYIDKSPGGKRTDAQKKSVIDIKTFRKHRVILTAIAEKLHMEALAQEKALRLNFKGFRGEITGFLEPETQIGNKVQLFDNRYPEREGVYLVDQTDVIFGVNGARRHIALGPKLGF